MFSRRAHTDAVVGHLSAQCDGELLVGDAEVLTGSGWQGAPGASEFVPYVVVYLIRPDRDGSLDDAQSWPRPLYQLTAVGCSREQAEWAIDKACAAIYDHPITVTGQDVVGVVDEDSDGARRDDDVTPSVWTAIERFRLMTE